MATLRLFGLPSSACIRLSHDVRAAAAGEEVGEEGGAPGEPGGGAGVRAAVVGAAAASSSVRMSGSGRTAEGPRRRHTTGI